MAAPSTSPQLQTYLAELDAIGREVRALLGEMSDDQIRWRPEPDSWSVGECIEHLNEVGHRLVPLIQEAVTRAREEELYGDGPFTYNVLEKAFIQNVGPSGRAVRTMRDYQPAQPVSVESTLARFDDLQRLLREEIIRANGLDLSRIKVSSPVARLIRMSLAAWLEATIAHERRHLAQARGVMDREGFPDA